MDDDRALLIIHEEIGDTRKLNIGDIITALCHLCELYSPPDSFFILLFEWYSTNRIESTNLGDATRHDKSKFLEICSNDSYFKMFAILSIKSDYYKRVYDNSVENNSLLHLRKLVSGMVLFRVEIFPALYPIIIESNIMNAIKRSSTSFRSLLRIECEFTNWLRINPIDTNNTEIEVWKFRPSDHKWWDTSEQKEAWMIGYDPAKRLQKLILNEYTLKDD